MLYTNWPSTGNSFEGAFGGYVDVIYHILVALSVYYYYHHIIITTIVHIPLLMLNSEPIIYFNSTLLKRKRHPHLFWDSHKCCMPFFALVVSVFTLVRVCVRQVFVCVCVCACACACAYAVCSVCCVCVCVCVCFLKCESVSSMCFI